MLAMQREARDIRARLYNPPNAIEKIQQERKILQQEQEIVRLQTEVARLQTEVARLQAERGQRMVGRHISIAEIKRAVCAAFGITLAEIESARRAADVARPRMLAMALSKHLTPHSYPSLGRQFGNRDHSTVIHAIRKMQPIIAAAKARVPPNASVREWVAACCAALAEAPR
jgi:chromosomal replication initiation ATPase DnaA